MTTTLIALVVAVLLLAALRLWLTANRLHRLHVRTEAAWVALDGALTRRSVCARALAAAGGLGPEQAALLRGLARRADHTARAQRAHAEDELSRALARLPRTLTPDLMAELADAQERVELARSFYNDAVRDARALREVWFTRFFRLAGSAVLLPPFVMTEITLPTAASSDRSGGPAPVGAGIPADGAEQPAAVARRSGRVVLLDADDRVLLFRGHDPAGTDPTGFWFTPGGGVEDGEDVVTCALRELQEETGLVLAPHDLAGPIWVRRARFRFLGELLDSEEVFFVARVGDGPLPLDGAGFTDEERDVIDEARWWRREELTGAGVPVYPAELAERFDEVLLARPGHTPVLATIT